MNLTIIARDLASSVYIDRDGRSYFSPDYTAWMLSTVAVCRTITAEVLLSLEKAWEQVAHDLEPSSGDPEKPYLLVTYHPDDERRVVFQVESTGAGQPGLENAVGLTLDVLERTYGDRFVRELRGAGLHFTPLDPPKGTPQDLIREIPERGSA